MSKPNWADKKCESTEWFTPPGILDRVRFYFRGPIPLDPATSPDNPTDATSYFTEREDGLSRSWDLPVFVNPPYGPVFRLWCQKIHEESTRRMFWGWRSRPILALLPCGARFSTRYFQRDILVPEVRAICFIQGRVAFLDEDGRRCRGNPYDSAIYGFNACVPRFFRAFRELGTCVRTHFQRDDSGRG